MPRNDDVKLKELLGRPDAKLVPVCEGKSLVTHGKGLSWAILGLQEAGQHLLPDSLIFLGLDPEGIPFFGAACKPESEGELILHTSEAGVEVSLVPSLAIPSWALAMC